MSDCFILLDDCNATPEAPTSRLYTGYRQTLVCQHAEQLNDLMALLPPLHHTVLLFDYELGAARSNLSAAADQPEHARLLVFAQCQLLSADEVTDWLQTQADTLPAGIINVQPSVDQADFSRSIERIRAYIEAGDTYQINYTYRLRFDTYGNLATLYQQLRARQPVPYGALMALPDGSALLSLSPELFIRHRAGALLAQPMKGTAAAGADAEYTLAAANALATDPKNRAENLMIVDLLRNDLSRVAALGSVAVPALFEVKRFGDVLQMTSSVTAQLRPHVSLGEVITALFPCGSITGAPKRRAMQIIDALETTPRGIYTGAIGWLESAPAARQIGDFCISVPIRTLLLEPADAAGLRHGEMGVGAGIVHDSIAADEYTECQLKASFLTRMPPAFSLFETMAVSRIEGCRLLPQHLQRLAHSAKVFHLDCDTLHLAALVKTACDALPDDRLYRMKLTLHENARTDLQVSPLVAIQEPVRLLMSPAATDSNDLFLRHKTTHRAQYDDAWRAAEAQGAFDMLFCNQRGEVTEGGRSNVFVQIDGQWYTPLLSHGVLPGVMRRILLDDPTWRAQECSLRPADIQCAQKIVVCSALRGVLEAYLI